MKCLVTGGAGFIGSHLTELLLSEGHHVTVLDHLEEGREENLSACKDNPRLKLVTADLRDREALMPHFHEIDWVFHLAAKAAVIASILKPQLYFDMNVAGTLNVLECARHCGVKKVLYAASSSCYGTPKTLPTDEAAPISTEFPYALTKYLGEELVMHWEKVFQVPAISLRLFNVYGPRAQTQNAYGAVFGVFLSQKLHDEPLTIVGDGTQERDFVYVTDVARAFYAAAQSPLSGEIFNVGSGTSYSMNHLAHLISDRIDYIPKRPCDPPKTCADISKIKRLLKWEPQMPFEEGVSHLLEEIETFRKAPLWTPDTIAKETESWFKHLS